MSNTMKEPTYTSALAFITKNSPKGSKRIAMDFAHIEDLFILAWVVDIPCSQRQGYYQAFGSVFQDGKFHEVHDSIPCQYYDDGENRIITTGSFLTNTSTTQAQQPAEKLLATSKVSPEEIQAKITLICQGKSISQILLREQCEKIKA